MKTAVIQHPRVNEDVLVGRIGGHEAVTAKVIEELDDGKHLALLRFRRGFWRPHPRPLRVEAGPAHAWLEPSQRSLVGRVTGDQLPLGCGIHHVQVLRLVDLGGLAVVEASVLGEKLRERLLLGAALGDVLELLAGSLGDLSM